MLTVSCMCLVNLHSCLSLDSLVREAAASDVDGIVHVSCQPSQLPVLGQFVCPEKQLQVMLTVSCMCLVNLHSCLSLDSLLREAAASDVDGSCSVLSTFTIACLGQFGQRSSCNLSEKQLQVMLTVSCMCLVNLHSCLSLDSLLREAAASDVDDIFMCLATIAIVYPGKVCSEKQLLQGPNHGIVPMFLPTSPLCVLGSLLVEAVAAQSQPRYCSCGLATYAIACPWTVYSEKQLAIWSEKQLQVMLTVSCMCLVNLHNCLSLDSLVREAAASDVDVACPWTVCSEKQLQVMLTVSCMCLVNLHSCLSLDSLLREAAASDVDDIFMCLANHRNCVPWESLLRKAAAASLLVEAVAAQSQPRYCSCGLANLRNCVSLDCVLREAATAKEAAAAKSLLRYRLCGFTNLRNYVTLCSLLCFTLLLIRGAVWFFYSSASLRTFLFSWFSHRSESRKLLAPSDLNILCLRSRGSLRTAYALLSGRLDDGQGSPLELRVHVLERFLCRGAGVDEPSEQKCLSTSAKVLFPRKDDGRQKPYGSWR
ncbi:hypothetical protein J6590_053786 [Homalodisca vitripennis]|nr:hypothetical protein J6590_053786 [Homalodisca vitripennis]